MRKNIKRKIIINRIGKNLNFCDKIIMKVLKKYTIKIYRIGLTDAFSWDNTENGKKSKKQNR